MKTKYKGLIIKRVLSVQLGVTLLIAAFAYGIRGLLASKSALLGGIVCYIPNLAFTWLAFKHEGARQAKKIAHGFYKAEALKITLTIVLFAIVFIMFDIHPIAFFGTYIVVQMVHWLAPWLLINENRSKSD